MKLSIWKEKYRFFKAKRNSSAYIRYLRSRGVRLGRNVRFFGNIANVRVDLTRPTLVRIGDDVKIVSPFALVTHGFEWAVFRNKYHEVVGSAGGVVIGNNVYIGRETTILKGVTIGDNVIIGAKSLVNKNIPSDCVAAGIPARKLIELDEYFERRKREQLPEAREYARSLYEVHGRLPVAEEFIEFFPLFLKRAAPDLAEFDRRMAINMRRMGRRPLTVRQQLGPAYQGFLESEPLFDSFEDFLRDCGLPPDEETT